MDDRRIVCAAIRLRSGLVICGVRHMDMIMRLNIAFMVPEGASATVLLKDHIQGFVDQFGSFHDREEAYVIAHYSGQLQKSSDSKKLYSEDVY